MPALLPADTVGCIGTCAGATTITAVAPAAFATAAATHGKHVKIAGATASWSDAGLGPSCNEVAFMQQTNLSFSIKLSGDAKFIDFGWCSPSLNPGGDWASSAEAGWMGEQGVDKAWIYRSSGWFKASTAASATSGKKFCLETVTTTDRGQVRVVNFRPSRPSVSSVWLSLALC